VRESCTPSSMSGKESRSDGLLGERGNERRRAPQAPPVLHATALLLDSTRKYPNRSDAVQVPEANGIAERFVRTARSDCLDWLLILNAGHLERALTVFIDHYNGWRPHRSLGLVPPNGRTSVTTWTPTQPIALNRRDRLGGLLHEYERAA
jgi:transposase InsO family protein